MKFVFKYFNQFPKMWCGIKGSTSCPFSLSNTWNSPEKWTSSKHMPIINIWSIRYKENFKKSLRRIISWINWQESNRKWGFIRSRENTLTELISDNGDLYRSLELSFSSCSYLFQHETRQPQLDNYQENRTRWGRAPASLSNGQKTPILTWWKKHFCYQPIFWTLRNISI